MKGLKKLKLLGLGALTLFIPTVTNAEKVCQEHTNYYFFAEINELQKIDLRVIKAAKNGNSIDTPSTKKHKTYYPALEGEKKSEGRVCLSKNNKSDGSNCVETWDLKKFYEKFRTLHDEGTPANNFKIPVETEKTTTYTQYDEDNTSYYIHGYWYEDETGGNYGKSIVDFFKTTTNETLINGSFLPSSTKITFNYEGTTDTDAIEATIERSISIFDYRKLKEGKTKDDINLNNINLNDSDVINAVSTEINKSTESIITPFKLVWHTGETEKEKTTLTPALYKVVYEKCEEKYKAEIEYVVKGEDGTETPAKESNKDITNYSKNGLNDGYTETVTTPELSGCTPDKSKVDVKIEGKDFYEKVIYTCPSDDEPKKNAGTGDALIYLVWAIGLGAIGYSVYYFRRAKNGEI